MSKLETNTIDTVSGTANLTIGGANNTGTTTIKSNNTAAITVDSSQNVGIGTSSPTTKLNLNIGTDNTGILVNSTDTTTGIALADNGGSAVVQTTSSGAFRVLVGGDASTTGDNSYEGMRIHDDGEVDINVDNSGTSVKALHVLPYGTSTGMYDGVQIATNSNRSFMGLFRQTTSASSHIIFYNTNGNIGSIQTSGTSTSFNTSSDHRLKENVNYDFDATSRLKELKPARFNFIKEADKTLDGFLAHEVQSIVPEAVHGTYNETETKQKVVVNSDDLVIAENIEQADWETGKIADDNGNTKYPTDSTWEATKVIPVYQGIDQAKLVPLLVKTIQELEARITALENA